MKDLLISVYEHNLALLRDENEELRKTNSGLIEGNIVLRNRIEKLSKAMKPTEQQIEEVFNNVFTGEATKEVKASFLKLIKRIIVAWENLKEKDENIAIQARKIGK